MAEIGTMKTFTESIVEDAVLVWPEGLGYAILHGPDIAHGEADARASLSHRGLIVVAREKLLGMLD